MGHDANASDGRPEMGPELTKGYAGSLIRWKIRAMAEQLSLCGADKDDLEQTLRTEVLIRSRSYRPDRGDWRTFVGTVIQNRAATLFQRTIRRRNRLQYVDPFDLTKTKLKTNKHRPLRHKSFDDVDHLEQRLDQAEVLSRLGPDDQLLCEELKFGSLSEAARNLGVPRSTICDQARRLREPLGNLCPEEIIPRNLR